MWLGESCTQRGQEEFLQNLRRNLAIGNSLSLEVKILMVKSETQKPAAHSKQTSVTTKEKKDKQTLFKESDLKQQNHISIWDLYSPGTST